jgi:hypothetical protein
LNQIKGVKSSEQRQEMIHKREVAVELLNDGAVRQKLIAGLAELREPIPQGPKLALR